MENPKKSSNVATSPVGDGLGVFDHEQKASYVLNATSALVYRHCDGETTPRQLAELLRQKLNVSTGQAEKMVQAALAELQAYGLLEPGTVPMSPAAGTFSRREAFVSLAALGLSVTLLPMVARVAQAQGGHVLIPLLECVDDNGNGTFTAHFGYLNQGSTTINLPVGPKNMFVPGQTDFGQPTVFLPGEHLNVFSVVFNATDTLKWMLKADGDKRHEVEATARAEACLPTTTMSLTTSSTTSAAPLFTTEPPF